MQCLIDLHHLTPFELSLVHVASVQEGVNSAVHKTCTEIRTLRPWGGSQLLPELTDHLLICTLVEDLDNKGMICDWRCSEFSHLQKRARPVICVLDPCRLRHWEIHLFVVNICLPVVSPFVSARQSSGKARKERWWVPGVGDEGVASKPIFTVRGGHHAWNRRSLHHLASCLNSVQPLQVALLRCVHFVEWLVALEQETVFFPPVWPMSH